MAEVSGEVKQGA